ncbi:hypothetical protein [Roseomonas sp. BN140053]|uniref:hypothetical protein n=1 Tax=Roseomonas sp. BN140053 TaxID=3391898 RepID=UPI0039E921C4
MSKVAVVCGALRQPLEFAAAIERLLYHRDLGHIDRIILSTWHGELGQLDGVADILSSHGVDVVEGTPPGNLGPGNIYAQKKALLQALLRLSPDTVVIKLRTDKSAVLLDRYVERCRGDLTPADPVLSGFTRRVVVSRLSTTLPFMIDDFAFIGLASDLLLMTGGSDGLNAYWAELQPTAEMNWMYAPLLRRDFMLERFFSSFRARRVSAGLMQLARNWSEIPAPIMSFLSHYWRIVHGSYEIIHNSPLPREYRPLDLLRQAAEYPHVRSVGEYVTITNEAIMAQIVATLPEAAGTEHQDVNARQVSATQEACEALAALFPAAVVKDVREHASNARGGNLPPRALLECVLGKRHEDLPSGEREILAQLMSDESRRVPFQNVMTQIARAYMDGSSGLPRRPDAVRHWAREAAKMRDPQALGLLVSLHVDPQAAVRDPDVRMALAAAGIRDGELFSTLAEAMLNQGMNAVEFPRAALLRGLEALASQGSRAAGLVLAAQAAGATRPAPEQRR